MSENCCCTENRKKATERDPQRIKEIQSRINRVSGQLEGVKKMVEENRYCTDILIQLSAISSAIKGLAGIIMEEHINTCVVEKISAGDTQITKELVELFKKFS